MTQEPGELLPCPFCWFAPEPTLQNGYVELGPHKPGEYFRAVHCFNCGASGRECATDAEAITAWNTRTSDELTHLRAENERLREALEAVLDDGHSYESEGMARDSARAALARSIDRSGVVVSE